MAPLHHQGTIPTQPIGSIPRPAELIEAERAYFAGEVTQAEIDPLFTEAIRDTIERFEATGSPVISDGEQRTYHNFATYAVHGSPNLAPDGFKLHFINHFRQWPRLTAGPFRYERCADSFLEEALRYAHVPVKQAIIAPSAASLFYPVDGTPGGDSRYARLWRFSEGLEVFELKDGRTREGDVCPQQVAGVCVGVVVSWRDIAERKRVEASLAAAERLLGYRAKEVVGVSTPSIVHDPEEVRTCEAEKFRASSSPRPTAPAST